MSTQTELMPAVREPQAVAVRQESSTVQMMQQILAGPDVKDKVDAFAKLCDLRVQEEKRDAEKEFNRAFVELQQEIPTIKAMKPVPDKYGNVKFMVADFNDIDDQARPICLKHGFTYSFSEGPFLQGKVTKVCTLFHVAGHSRSNSYSVRIGSGPPGCSEMQADGSAHSYSKRGALCDCLNIRIDRALSNDVKDEGGFVSAEQADELERRVGETLSNREAFLKFAGADVTVKFPYRTIPAHRYDACDQMLRKKAQQK